MTVTTAVTGDSVNALCSREEKRSTTGRVEARGGRHSRCGPLLLRLQNGSSSMTGHGANRQRAHDKRSARARERERGTMWQVKHTATPGMNRACWRVRVRARWPASGGPTASPAPSSQPARLLERGVGQVGTAGGRPRLGSAPAPRCCLPPSCPPSPLAACRPGRRCSPRRSTCQARSAGSA